MKYHFEPNFDFHVQAIEAVCDLFRSQELSRSEFTVTREPKAPQGRLAFAENDLGIGNGLTLLDDEILYNFWARIGKCPDRLPPRTGQEIDVKVGCAHGPKVFRSTRASKTANTLGGSALAQSPGTHR